MSDNRTGQICNPAQERWLADMQSKWSAWIDARVAAAVTAALHAVAESVGDVIAKERERSLAEVKAMIAITKTETRLEIVEAKSAVLEHVTVRMDNRFDNLQRQIGGALAGHADAEATLRALPAPTSTRQ